MIYIYFFLTNVSKMDYGEIRCLFNADYEWKIE